MKKIVLSYLGGLGDTLLMTPILRAIKEKYPQSQTIVLVAPAAKALFEYNKDVDLILGYEKGAALWPILRSIWRADAAFLFDNTSRTRQIMWLARVKERLGFSRQPKHFLTKYLEKREDGQRYQAECYFDLTRLIGIDRADKTALFLGECQKKEKQAVDERLRQLGLLQEEEFITIAPYSLDYYKDWPEESYNQVIASLRQQGYRILLVGGKELEEKAVNFPQTLYLKGLNPRQSAYLIAKAKLMICGCTFALHLAATTPTPILALYGKTSSTRWAAYKNCTVLREDVDCRDLTIQKMDFCATEDGKCHYDKLCMRKIQPQQVIDKALQILVPS